MYDHYLHVCNIFFANIVRSRIIILHTVVLLKMCDICISLKSKSQVYFLEWTKEKKKKLTQSQKVRRLPLHFLLAERREEGVMVTMSGTKWNPSPKKTKLEIRNLLHEAILLFSCLLLSFFIQKRVGLRYLSHSQPSDFFSPSFSFF